MAYEISKDDERRIKGFIISRIAPALGEDDIEDIANGNSLGQVIFGWMHLKEEHWKHVRDAFEYHVGKHHPKFNKKEEDGPQPS